jgi:tetratricopeptide (TPR) repeat protein
MYTRLRHIGNPKFFEETRSRLAAILRDVQVLIATGVQSTANEALELILESQWAAHGFLLDRQFHKSLTLGELCLQIVDMLTIQAQGTDAAGSLVFWRLLTRANLGNAYVRFRKLEEATAILKQALELFEVKWDSVPQNAEQSMSLKANLTQERMLVGTIYSHLSHIHLETGDLEEAVRLTDLMIEVFEKCIWDLGDSHEERELEASVLATAYSNRGVSELRRGDHEKGLAWLGRAQECLEKYGGLSNENGRIQELIKDHIEHANLLKSWTEAG